MTFSRSATALMSDAASKLKSLAREIRTPGLKTSSILAQERLHDLAAALDQFVASTASSLRALREAGAPYVASAAETAGHGAVMLRDGVAANVSAVGKKLTKRRGMIARHPYVAVLAVVGAGYLAVRSLLNGVESPAARAKPSARTPTARAKRTRQAAATRTRASRSPRRPQATTTAQTNGDAPNPLH